MKKGILGLLLLCPFLIAFLAFTTSDYLIKGVEQDIADIEIEYPSLAPFGLKQGKQKLTAEAIFNKDYPLSDGNQLVFSAPEDQEVARIDKESDGYYFVPLSEGQVEVTVSNEKGNVAKRFTALVYGEAGALVVNLDYPFSASGMKSYYWGTDDISYASIDSPYIKKEAVIDFSASVYGNESMDIFDFRLEHSENLSVDLNNQQIKVLGVGESYVRFVHPFSTSTPPTEISFTAVEAVNVYSYADLLKATNLSESGEAAVLHVNIESQANYNALTSKKQTDVFGKVNEEVNPEAHTYSFVTTYNHEFIDGWNKKNIFPVSNQCVAGIRLRQSLYGNGFLINGHDLCYPSSHTTLEDGTIQPILSPSDLFRGPKVFASAGDPASPYETSLKGVEPLLVLYGQDNCLIYADGDDITIDNLRLRNADFGNNYQNLATAGTGIDIHGQGVTVSNSVISSARTLIRTFSSKTSIDNCLLQNALDYGVKIGADEFNRVDGAKPVAYKDSYGVDQKTNAADYLKMMPLNSLTHADAISGKADSILSAGIMYQNQADVFLNNPYFRDGRFSYDAMVQGGKAVKDALTNTKGYVNADGSKNYHSEATVEDCFFYNCHVAPIALDSYPTGPFLYNNISTLFALILSMYIEYYPTNLALTMAPSLLTLAGDNRFYNYQELGNLSFDTLVTQDIDSFINAHGGLANLKSNVTEDDYLPIRELIGQQSSALYKNGDKTYVNSPIMKMGGGSNLSDVVFESGGLASYSLNCYDHVLSRSATIVPDELFMTSDEGRYTTMKVALSRAASNVMGFEDYVFYTLDMAEHPYFGQTPSLSELSARS